MPYDELKEQVWRANMSLVEAGLVTLTFGNASGVHRKAGVVAIKPSGVSYEEMRVEDMVVLSLETGKTMEGRLKPSSDTATHLELYRAFDSIGGIVHTHSTHATSWAQARREIPCLGTTHADYFNGPVPLTRALPQEEISEDYEVNTGRVIVDRFKTGGLDPAHFPGVLVAPHGPFAGGTTAPPASENAILLEELARLAFQTVVLNPSIGAISQPLLDKHFLRKHGPEAYYGQTQ
jgi:L-ribulose-5-phosphate 4-epimerase